MKLSRKNINRPYISFLLFSTLLTSCSPNTPTNQVLSNLGMDGIYSTRPQTEEPVITILKLQNPALLETAERKDGKLIVDEKLKKALLEEQEETIKALLSISSQIKILIRYKLVLNGMAIWAPAAVIDEVRALPNVLMVERAGRFDRPVLPSEDEEEEESPKIAVVGDKTSVKFIGAEEAYTQGIRGQGMKVGIIDTGIDFTHKMLGGEGTVEAFKAVDPTKPTAAFPNKKVVGGIDLVGTRYNSAALISADRIPVPDLNPIDEARHGTHVAGTIGGIGDDVTTYSGVAPDADLYAIKVFGKSGSTSDEVVIAALEYAINPSGDGKFEDQLDVVNLSLGSGFGSSHTMYSHAIRNTVAGGTIVVASAGNSGDIPYITGAPAVSDDAISVASSVDNMAINTDFPTVEFTLSNGQKVTSEIAEGDKSLQLEKVTALTGEVVAVGLLKEDLSDEKAALVQGKIALADRGESTFAEKAERAQKAGAIAIIIANNKDEDPSPMSMGDKKITIPAVMITKKVGAQIKEQLKTSAVTVDLKSTVIEKKPWLVDTMSSFSSRGPRSEDGKIKPEISSPGSNIISAGARLGDKGIYMSGTSMAGPHIAGVMALLKQKFPKLTPYELKSVLLGHAKPIADKNKKLYTVSRQGAGRVQIAESLKASVISVPSTLSFGLTDVEKQKTVTEVITLKNISDKAMTLTPEWSGSAALKFSVEPVTLEAGEQRSIVVTVRIATHEMTKQNDELDGFLKFKTSDSTVLQLPALAVVRQISQVTATATVQATSPADSAGSAAEVTLENKGFNKGPAYLFNLLGTDGRKKGNKMDLLSDRNCDLQSAGYRIVESKGQRVLQIAAKLYEGMTSWHSCEVNVQLDSNGDGIADQELAGTTVDSLGLSGTSFMTLVLDANKAREIRKEYEKKLKQEIKDKAKETDPKKAALTTKLDYSEALETAHGMTIFDGSTLAIIETPISDLALSDNGDLQVKISTTHQNYGTIEMDDYLGGQDKTWMKISTTELGQAFAGLPKVVEIEGQDSTTISLKKGYSTGDLVLYAPQNRGIRDTSLEDTQSQIVPVIYNQGK